MKHARFMVLALTFSLVAATTWASVAPPSQAAQREQTRKELTAFFNGLSDSTPGSLGAIKKSPETLKAVKGRIDTMSDRELAEFRQVMADVPDWKNTPQVLSKLIPPEAMKKLQAESSDFAARVPAAEKMRDDVRTLVATLKLVPDAKLQELGVDKKKLDEIDQSLQQLTPLQVAILQKQLTQAGGWEMQGAAAMNSIPPELQKGALALAKHGPITALDIVELEKYRARLISLLKRVSALPESSRKSLNVESLTAQASQLGEARPDALFMLREQVTPEMLGKLDESVTMLEKVANLSPAEQKQLEEFRSQVTDAFAAMAGNADQAGEIREKLGHLGQAEMYMLKQGMPDFEEWKVTAPAMVQALSTPGLDQRITELKQPNPDPARVQDLENFRAQALAYIDAARADVAPALAESARKAVAEATLPKLELIRSVNSAMPEQASASARLQMASNISLNCVVSLGSIDLGDVLGSYSLGSINFNWICDPIANAINAVAGQIQAAVDAVSNAINATITTVQNALQSAITAVTNTVNTLVAGIISTVDTIWSFVQTIPTLAWNAIKAALNLLLDIDLGHGITIRGLINDGLATTVPKLQAALNLAGNWWSALGQAELPLIPCPAAGIHTPFGTVGDGFAVTNYKRYKFFIDKIIGLIPDTETSLEIKIPAQVLYAAFDYLGVCLEDAANDAAEQVATNRYTSITTNQTLLGQQLTLSFTALTNLSNTQGANITSQITNSTNMIQALINSSTNNLMTLINNKSLDLTNLINNRSDDQRDLDLRMQIELNLQAGEGKALAAFQLPHANGGYLELARDIVNSAMTAMLAAGQGVGQAQKIFAQAQSDMGLGKFKDAYKGFQKAYNELTK